MQTNFTPEQLRNPRVAEADDILRRCVHCGLCTATCPTYVLLGDERDSPRGRIYLIKDMLEENAPASYEVQTHLDRCLSCLSCMSTCPSGVDYMHLIDMARSYVEQTAPRPLQRALRARAAGARAALSRALPAGTEAGAARPPVAQRCCAVSAQRDRRHDRAGARRAAAVAEVRRSRHRRDRGRPPRPRHHARGLRAAGAAPRHQRFHHPPAGAARRRRRGRGRRRLLRRATYHLGDEAGAIAFAKRNVDAWSKELAKGPVDAIIVNASGCGTTVKDYGHLLKREPEYAGTRGAHLRSGARHLRVRRQVRARRAEALVVAARRLSPGVLAAARPGHQGGAARSAHQGGIHRRRHSGIAHLLRLGRNLQHPAAGARRRAARAQDRRTSSA